MTEVSFSSVVGMNVFRVIQESINNAIKHAKASKITVAFQQDESIVTIEIKDNGKGFDKTNFIAGNGLSNIESRVASINGKVFIESEPNKGTSIRVQLEYAHL